MFLNNSLKEFFQSMIFQSGKIGFSYNDCTVYLDYISILGYLISEPASLFRQNDDLGFGISSSI
jgi:hypothetical protein